MYFEVADWGILPGTVNVEPLNPAIAVRPTPAAVV